MLKWFLLLTFPIATFATELADAPVPIFLKYGYSSILDFDETPTQVVLGDTQSFQVEKLKTSIVIRSTTDEATTNMFVYFKKQSTRLFILSASEDAEPTYYRKFESLKNKALKITNHKEFKFRRSTIVSKILFDEKKDYLQLDIIMSADSTANIAPIWKKTLLNFKNKKIKPDKVWSEREIVQKDSRVKAQFTFKRPDVSRSLNGAKLEIPIKGYAKPILLNLKKEAN